LQYYASNSIIDCINNAFAYVNTATCSSLETDVCSAINNCGATACETQLSADWSCRFPACYPINCWESASETPTMSPNPSNTSNAQKATAANTPNTNSTDDPSNTYSNGDPSNTKTTGGFPVAAVVGIIGALLVVGIAVCVVLLFRRKKSKREGPAKVPVRTEEPRNDLHQPNMNYSIDLHRQEQVPNYTYPQPTRNILHELEIQYPVQSTREICGTGRPKQDYSTSCNSLIQNSLSSYKHQCPEADVPMAIAVMPEPNSPSSFRAQ
jgi:hypothetical protein